MQQGVSIRVPTAAERVNPIGNHVPGKRGRGARESEDDEQAAWALIINPPKTKR